MYVRTYLNSYYEYYISYTPNYIPKFQEFHIPLIHVHQSNLVNFSVQNQHIQHGMNGNVEN